MKLLFLDLETTGLPRTINFNTYHSYKKTAHYNSSRIVQIALLVYESIDNSTDNSTDNTSDSKTSSTIPNAFTDKFKLTAEHNFIIKPDGFTITNSNIHGITQQIAEFTGISFETAVKNIKQDLISGDLLVAHNILFDKNVLLSEMFRHNMLDECRAVENTLTFCTSKQTSHLTKIKFNRSEYKQPKLSELYTWVFNETASGLHDALQDTRVMVKIFFELIKRNLIVLVQD